MSGEVLERDGRNNSRASCCRSFINKNRLEEGSGSLTYLLFPIPCFPSLPPLQCRNEAPGERFDTIQSHIPSCGAENEAMGSASMNAETETNGTVTPFSATSVATGTRRTWIV